MAPESAFMAVRKSELDFLVVHSLEEAIAAVAQLKNQPTLYRAIVENGWKRSQEFTEEKITADWMHFFHHTVFPQYETWLSLSKLQRQASFLDRYIRFRSYRLQGRIPQFNLPQWNHLALEG